MASDRKISIINTRDKLQFVSGIGVLDVLKQDIVFVGAIDSRIVLYKVENGSTKPGVRIDPTEIMGFESLNLAEARSVIAGYVERKNAATNMDPIRVPFTGQDTVTINHGWGIPPSIIVLDLSGSEIDCEVDHLDGFNTCLIEFDAPESGVVILKQ